MNKMKRIRPLVFGLLSLVSVSLFTSCDPDAKWVANDVTIKMEIVNVSAGFIECKFSTNKEAYYLVSIEEVKKGENPMDHQKQFMMLALDSANAEYISWRYDLLKQNEFNIAPFSSHALQYGSVDYFFTGLLPDTEYWVYAFVVDPETMKPTGKLYLQQVNTTLSSVMNIHFDYRIKGRWDYIYPLDTTETIFYRFPYIATTRDSLTLAADSVYTDSDALWYFLVWTLERFLEPEKAKVLFGVHAVQNDGMQSSEYFEIGHTYYTAISGFDGSFKQTTVYKFTWTGDTCDMYLCEKDSSNIMPEYPEGD